MARLTNLGAGDLTDRLTILALKLLHYGAAGKDTKHLQDERNVLLGKLRGRELNGPWFELVLELGAVNAALWAETDKLREFERGPAEDYTDLHWHAIGSLGISIMRLNDRRAALVDEINKLTGEFLGAEKG